MQQGYRRSVFKRCSMADKNTPSAEPPKAVEVKPEKPAQKPMPAPARRHMVNDHDLSAVKKGKTRLDEKSGK